MHPNTKRRIIQLARRHHIRDVAWMLNRPLDEVRKVVKEWRQRSRA